MSALNVTCAGAVYHGCTTLEVMKYRCPQWQPGNDMPVNAAPEESEEEVEAPEEDGSGATDRAEAAAIGGETESGAGEEPASDDESSDDEE